MLELRRTCERCGVSLAPADTAMICAFECTFCPTCADGPLAHTCPNCGGELVVRPRPARGYTWTWGSPGPVRSLVATTSALTGSVRARVRRTVHRARS